MRQIKDLIGGGEVLVLQSSLDQGYWSGMEGLLKSVGECGPTLTGLIVVEPWSQNADHLAHPAVQTSLRCNDRHCQVDLVVTIFKLVVVFVFLAG